MNDNKPECWLPQRKAARVSEISLRNIQNWLNNGTLSGNEFREVNLLELFRVQIAKLDQEFERLKGSQSSPNSPEARLTLAHCRKTEATADLLEIELKQAGEKLISIEQAQAEFKLIAQVIRQKMMELPKELGEKIAEMQEPKAIAALLEDSIYTTLRELSQGLTD